LVPFIIAQTNGVGWSRAWRAPRLRRVPTSCCRATCASASWPFATGAAGRTWPRSTGMPSAASRRPTRIGRGCARLSRRSLPHLSCRESPQPHTQFSPFGGTQSLEPSSLDPKTLRPPPALVPPALPAHLSNYLFPPSVSLPPHPHPHPRRASSSARRHSAAG